MRIICESCKNEISASDVNIKDKIAKCNECNNIFNCSSQLEDIGVSQENQFREDIGLPKGVTVKSDFSKLVIERKWFHPMFLFLTMFCMFWDGFLIVWYTIAISKGEWGMAAFATGHAVVGICLTYWTIGGYVNKTIMTVTKDSLDIEHKPLLFPGAKKLSSRDLKQLYTKEQISRSRNGTTCTFDVNAKTHSGKDIKIIERLMSSEEALYVEQEVERFLHIDDVPVRGEIPR